MYKLCMLLCVLFIYSSVKAQNNILVVVKDAATKQPINGANVVIPNSTFQKSTNANGVVFFSSVSNGKQILQVTFVGYQTYSDTLTLPTNNADSFFVYLTIEEEEEEEVIVQSTRTSRTIKNTPTRVETIDGEELDEKNNMRPANVSMLLHESTGLQVQQTSATTGNANIRVQGLDGRYTQLLKDGYPNFGNFASGLSVLEIPPLDLKQVEIIKGPASTLYGGGAISGVVNFVSKTPKEKFQGDVIINQSNIGQINIGAFIAHRKNKIGYSLLAAANFSKVYDVDRDGFTEIPKSNNFTFHPKLFFYIKENASLMIGNSFTKGKNEGGDVKVIKGNAGINNVYFENNKTTRNTTTAEFDTKFKNNSSLKIKQSVSLFERKIEVPSFVFSGLNTNVFSEVSYSFVKKSHNLIAGLNTVFDKFKQRENSVSINQSAQSFTTGLYIQDTWDASEKIKVEGGLRIDNANYKNVNFSKNQLFVLPRFSVLLKLSESVTSRVGAGLGYKLPTIFTEQTEALQYKNVRALNNVKAEQSIGGTADVNFRTTITNDFNFSANQLFFITQINTPLVLGFDNFSNQYFFSNQNKPVITSGFETNLKFIYKEDLKLFVGYTFTNAKAKYITGNQYLTLLPKHKLNLTMMYEKEDNFKLGLEGYLTDRQFLTTGSKTPSFWEFGFMAQKTFGKFSFYVNFENFTDQRQSKYKGVANPPTNNPTFDEIWNHTEGFVWNGGIKIKL
ncbi:MAG: TonB-dependent receptor [Ferruginibacter sp.]|nr:TonB-dependent receptor [Ferruginibacter sp.]